MNDAFDYEGKIWGANEVKLSPCYLNALRLKYCLEDLEGVQGRVLEVGCGGGGMARAIKFHRPDLEVHGCDVSGSAISAALARPGGVSFSVCDAYHLAFPRDHFSAVVMFDVLEHLDLPGKAVGEVSRVLTLGGLFHVFVPCEGSLLTLHGLFAKLGWRPKESYGGHVQLLTAPSAQDLLRQQGFEVGKRRWSGHFINQLFDISYFTFLALRGRNVSKSLEGYLETERQGMLARLLRVAKHAVALLSYCESSLLHGAPGWGLHLRCARQRRQGLELDLDCQVG